jgi:hypothetical protein
VHGTGCRPAYGVQRGEQRAHLDRVQPGVRVAEVDPAVRTQELTAHLGGHRPSRGRTRFRRRDPGLPAGEVERAGAFEGVDPAVVDVLEGLLDRPVATVGDQPAHLSQLAPRHGIAE